MGVALKAGPKGMESPSSPKGAVVAMGAGLRAGAKGLESPTDPKATRAARLAVTLGVMGQKSAKGIVAKRPPSWVGQGKSRNLRERVSRASLNGYIAPDGAKRSWRFVA